MNIKKAALKVAEIIATLFLIGVGLFVIRDPDNIRVYAGNGAHDFNVARNSGGR